MNLHIEFEKGNGMGSMELGSMALGSMALGSMVLGSMVLGSMELHFFMGFALISWFCTFLIFHTGFHNKNTD